MLRLPRPTSAAFRVALVLGLGLLASRRSVAGARLDWTAPGDDGGTGTATRYDIRRSTQPITAANFVLADTVSGAPAPAAAGTPQSCAVALPSPGVTYYFAMRTMDECGNWSALSNVVSRSSGTAGVESGSTVCARLDPPCPNPAFARVRLPFTVPGPCDVTLEVFDAAGRRCRTLRAGRVGSGPGAIEWDLHDDRGAAVARGRYFVRASLGRVSLVRSITVR